MMTTNSIIEALEQLPLEDKLLVLERTLHSIRQQSSSVSDAVDFMSEEYKNNPELTIFTQLDSESFYEAR